jgi:hypothetical protein
MEITYPGFSERSRMAEKEKKQDVDSGLAKPRKKKGCCLWIFLGLVAIGLIIIAMPVFRICPPAGPWPTPPWCYDKDDCTNYPGSPIDGLIRRISDAVGATGLKVGNACMVMRSYGKNTFIPYEYQELDYLTDTEKYTPVDRDITFGVGIADYWGNNYIFPKSVAEKVPDIIEKNWFTMGTDPRKHNNIENTTKWVSQLGATYIFFEDFIQLIDEDLTLVRDDEPGVESMTQKELNKLASESKANGLEPILQLTINDSIFAVELAEYFNSGKYGSAYDVMDNVQWYDQYSTGEDTLALHNNWRAVILEEARMAEEAGFSALFVNPQNGGWHNSGEYVAIDNAEWLKTIVEIRKVFTGKLGVAVQDAFMDEGYTYFKEADLVIVSTVIDHFTRGLKKTNMDGIIAGWKEYLKSPQFEYLEGVPEVIQGITFCSYPGALDRSWIEAGGHYPDLEPDQEIQAIVYEAFFRALYETPETRINGVAAWGANWHDYIYPNTHEIRTDLDLSIRNKDAANVFHRWQSIFK